MTHLTLRITGDGRVLSLWDDTVDWSALGALRVTRASHVEFCAKRQAWCVRPARPRAGWRRLWQALCRCPRGEVLFASASREAALAWEHEYFAPGGPGWCS